MGDSLILLVIVVVLYLKLISKFNNLYISYKSLGTPVLIKKGEGTVKILILIPALREQNVIRDTLNHFKNMIADNIELLICVAGTTREKMNCTKGKTTGEVVREWIDQNESEFPYGFEYIEVNEKDGDRASQLNYAVNKIGNQFSPDIIGVYDADSLPDLKTVLEVSERWRNNPNTVLQQPVHFVKAANRMAKNKMNPILVANALNQTTWTIIREYPTWLKHHMFCKLNNQGVYYRNDYLIGHGEFIPYAVYKKFSFPEQQITDGIQLGYRLSMSGHDICPLKTFCDDDVPQSLTQLVNQHKRWFGGCNKLIESYNWCQQTFGKSSIIQVIDGYWSQLCWLSAGIVSIIGCTLACINIDSGKTPLAMAQVVGVLVYCYVIPYLAHVVIREPVSVRLIDWLCLPLAMLLKVIGPCFYVYQYIVTKLFGGNVEFSKVER